MEGYPFKHVHVDFVLKGTTRVTWALVPCFDEAPYSFQLQASRQGGGDWVNVGTPVVDQFFALDDNDWLCRGSDQRLTYRVVMTSSQGTYTSLVAHTLGKLTVRQWLESREIVRRAMLPVKQKHLKSLDGYLLKRKIQGTKCTECRDPHTGGITNSSCETCRGTGYLDGYWLAAEHQMINLSPELRNTHRDNNLRRGTVDDMVAQGRFIGTPLVFTRDCWVDKKGGQRYLIGKCATVARVRWVPLVVDVELSLAPRDHIVYTIPIDEEDVEHAQLG